MINMFLLCILSIICVTYSQTCIEDNKDNRLFSDLMVSDMMTPDMCKNYCQESLFFGTQWGMECWCGKSDQSHEYQKYEDGVCDIPCGGDDSISCGGKYSITIYTLDSVEIHSDNRKQIQRERDQDYSYNMIEEPVESDSVEASDSVESIKEDPEFQTEIYQEGNN